MSAGYVFGYLIGYGLGLSIVIGIPAGIVFLLYRVIIGRKKEVA
jgi:hypothetical protein